MKNKEFSKGAVAGALVVTCIGTGAFAGTGLAAKGTALGDRKCKSKLVYLEELIDRYYLGDKDEEKLQEGLYAGLLYGCLLYTSRIRARLTRLPRSCLENPDIRRYIWMTITRKARR